MIRNVMSGILLTSMASMLGCASGIDGNRDTAAHGPGSATSGDYRSQVILGSDVEDLKVGPDLNTVKLYVPNDSGTGAMSAGVEKVKQRSMIPEHIHTRMEEIIYVVEGDGLAIVGGQKHKVSGGDMVRATPGTAHGFVNTGNTDLKLFVIYNKNDMMGFFRDYSFKDPEDVRKRFNQDFMKGLLTKYGDLFTVPRSVALPAVTKIDGMGK